MSVITASAKLLEPVFQLAQHYGMDPAMVLSCAQLSSEEFAKPGARFPAYSFSHVLQALVHASNNPRIALNLGEATQPRLLGSIGFIMYRHDVGTGQDVSPAESKPNSGDTRWISGDHGRDA